VHLFWVRKVFLGDSLKRIMENEREDIFKEIYGRHCIDLNNLNVRNKRVAVCFSGIPGSGKTTIARVLEKRYKGVRLNGDDIGKIIRNLIEEGVFGNEIDIEKLKN
jgi:2-phosphoglycerate kinase